MPRRPGGPPSQFIAENVERFRTRRGWTQQQLAEAMGEWSGGWKMDRSTIAKIESRKRSVSLDEWLWLSWTLGVSPMALLFPRRAVDYIRVAPDYSLQLAALADWYRGISLPAADFDAQRYFDEARPDWEVQAERSLPGVLALLAEASAIVSALSISFGGASSADVSAAMLDDLIEHASLLRQAITREGRTELLERIRKDFDGDRQAP